MEYNILERDFIDRTFKIIEQYDQYIVSQTNQEEKYEVTLLINCLLGLLIIPNEKLFNAVPPLPIDQLTDWGLQSNFVHEWGKRPLKEIKLKVADWYTLVELVYQLRNSVAHTRFKPTGDGKDILEIEFTDRNGFRASIPIKNLRAFVFNLAATVKPK